MIVNLLQTDKDQTIHEKRTFTQLRTVYEKEVHNSSNTLKKKENYSELYK